MSVGFPLLPEFRAEKLLRECALRAAVGRCARLQRLSHAGQQQRWVHEEDPCPTSVASGSRLSLQVLWRALSNTCFGPVLFSARLGDATCCPRAMSFVVATSQFKNAPSRTEFRNSWSVPTVSAQPNASKNSAEDLTMRWRWCRKLTRSRQENAAGRRSQSRYWRGERRRTSSSMHLLRHRPFRRLALRPIASPLPVLPVAMRTFGMAYF